MTVTLHEEEIERRRAMARERAKRYRARLRGEDIPKRKNGMFKGYQFSPEVIANRQYVKGERHWNWGGEQASEKAGRARALHAFKQIGPCSSCGAEKSERHHVDGDTTNNVENNIQILCRCCHMETDGRMETFREMARRK